ncbi:MAG: alpha/beta fold hydrolase [Candidatus Limnocylindrales bacterium]
MTFTSAGLTLAGTFAAPASAGPFPAALLLAGSGPLDRDGNVKRMALNVSRDLARELATAGWASYRYDKRGVGASQGEYLSTGFTDELADAAAALEALEARDDVARVVVIGHSAGAVHAASLAGREPAIAGAVLLAATAKTGEETLRWQARKIGQDLVPRPVKALMRLFRTDVLKQQDSAIAKLKATNTDVARIQLQKVNAKWMREFIAFDPVPVIAATRAPMLAITGSKDVQVDPADLGVIASTAADAHVLEVPDMDHVLRHESSATSNPRHYAKQVQQPIDPRVVAAILGWLPGANASADAGGAGVAR